MNPKHTATSHLVMSQSVLTSLSAGLKYVNSVSVYF